jgi:hypothetical protein
MSGRMKFKCKICDSVHELRQRACQCCNESTEITQYRCSECSELYSMLDSADTCCEDMKIEEVEE